MSPLAARAPGKVNLCLFLGPVRADGRHELVSVVQSVSLADELVIEPAPPGTAADVVECPGVEGPNLAAAALSAFRARTGWDAPAQRLRITKRVPVAAGMGGGSGDAAAALRLAAALAGLEDEPLLLELATSLGADVPAQIRPGRVLAQGAGERVRRLPEPGTAGGSESGSGGSSEPGGIVIVPNPRQLSTAAVFAEADRLGLGRDAAGLAEAAAAVESGLRPDGTLARELLVNELEPAARSLCPELGGVLEAVQAAGADVAMVSGSGPTVAGFFFGPDGPAAAREAATRLAGRWPGSLAVTPVGEEFGRPFVPADVGDGSAVARVRHNLSSRFA
jgi:4-diphosphocytidyl-2-C-methyl-D-erythritol kinase